MLSKNTLLLLLIFLLSVFLYFIRLTTIPSGLNQDETAIGYNAYSILTTGKDEYGTSFPLYFKSFGDQKLPAYIYLTAASESVFGLTPFAVRLPSAILGSLTVVLLYFLVKELTGNKKIALLSSLFLAINPWHFFFSRAAFEDNAGLFFAVSGIWLFLLGLRTKKWAYLFLSMLGFALSLYSYNVTRLLAPVLLFSLIYLNWKTIKVIPQRVKISLGIFLIILLSPFLVTFLSPAGVSSAHGALITSTDIQAKGLEFRSYLVGTPVEFLGKVFFNKYFYLGWQYAQNLVASLSTPFLFVTGSPHGSQGIGTSGLFYLLEFPLILIGLIFIIKNKQQKYYFFIVWAVITWLTLSLSKEVPHATRGYFLVIPFEVFSALGFYQLVQHIRKYRSKNIRLALFSVITILCIYNLTYFFTSYFVRFPQVYVSGWRQQDQAVASFIKDTDSKYQKVIFDSDAGYIYTSLAFYNAYPPEEFQKTVKRLPDDTEGFSTVSSFGKYEWKKVDWNKDLSQPKTLIITSPDKLPSSLTPMARFLYPSLPIVLSIKEQIAQYPTQSAAYVAVESK